MYSAPGIQFWPQTSAILCTCTLSNKRTGWSKRLLEHAFFGQGSQIDKTGID